MAKPIPPKHAMAEPWFQYLLTLQQPPHARFRLLGAPCRSLLEASVEVAESRRVYYDSVARQTARIAEFERMTGEGGDRV